MKPNELAEASALGTIKSGVAMLQAHLTGGKPARTLEVRRRIWLELAGVAETAAQSCSVDPRPRQKRAKAAPPADSEKPRGQWDPEKISALTKVGDHPVS